MISPILDPYVDLGLGLPTAGDDPKSVRAVGDEPQIKDTRPFVAVAEAV
jgi:hypothetical protein